MSKGSEKGSAAADEDRSRSELEDALELGPGAPFPRLSPEQLRKMAKDISRLHLQPVDPKFNRRPQ